MLINQFGEHKRNSSKIKNDISLHFQHKVFKRTNQIIALYSK